MTTDSLPELDDIFRDPLFTAMPQQEVSLLDIPEDMQAAQNARRKRKKIHEVAQRQPCLEFDEVFRPLFARVEQELHAGIRRLLPHRDKQALEVGGFYIVGDDMLYLAEITEELRRAPNGMPDGRTRCIYASGQESNILLQTLRRNVNAGGYVITEPEQYSMPLFADDEAHAASSSGTLTGYIYVLRSRSTVPEIAELNDLYKVGFTTTTVEERIKGAATDETYLCAPVEIVATYQLYGLDPHRVEQVIHQALEGASLRLTLTRPDGTHYTPREWFVVPLDIIDRVVRLLSENRLAGHSYNASRQAIEYHEPKLPKAVNPPGLRILTLNIKQIYFDAIISGEKTIEYRQLKPTQQRKYLYQDPADGRYYLKPYDALRLYVGYHRDRDTALVEVVDITYDADGGYVEYHLGRILEHIAKD